MSEELLINVSPMESRVAILNDGVLRELYIERHNKVGLVGNIYIGTVVRVLPGMQAAFVDIGQSRTAFLHVNDMQKPRKPESKKPLTIENKTGEQATNQVSNQANNQVSNQVSNQANNQPINNQLNSQSSEQTTNQSINQPVNRTNNQPIVQANNPLNEQAINEQTNTHANKLINNPTTNDPTTNEAIKQYSNDTHHNTAKTHTIQTLPSTRTTPISAVNAVHSINGKTIGGQKGININPKINNQLNQQLNNKITGQFGNNTNNRVRTKTTISHANNTNNTAHNNGNSHTNNRASSMLNFNQFNPNSPNNNIKSSKRETLTLVKSDNNKLPVAPPAEPTAGEVPVLVAEETVSPETEQQTVTVIESIYTDEAITIPPTVRVLPTVNKTLKKAVPVPQYETNSHNQDLAQQANVDGTDGNNNKDFDSVPSDSFTTTKAKRQAKVDPSELIQNRLREGQRILVQVTKDQLGTKGARLTTNISLPSRYLVYLPSSDTIGISQRIDNKAERNRLRQELASIMQTVNLSGGIIARTAAEHIPAKKLEEDIYYLLQLWRTIHARRQQLHSHQSSMMVYQELSLPLRSIRDHVHEDTERVVVDDANTYEHIRQFAHEFVPMIYTRIVPYHSQQPMFDVFRVEEDLRDALKRRVDLKSGGYLIIDQTEAMTTIDVNTGSYVGGRSLEDTVYKTNLEATHAIARQLRLRNLGGIIILDFIDMQEQEHKDDVLISLQTQLANDYARTNITQISELGLVEMTRKRTRESLEQQLCEPCSTCDGKGFVKTAETVCFEIFREIMRCARTYNAPKQFTVVAHASVIDLLLTSEADTVADLEYLLGRVITFEVETLYTQEQYDIVLD